MNALRICANFFFAYKPYISAPFLVIMAKGFSPEIVLAPNLVVAIFISASFTEAKFSVE